MNSGTPVPHSADRRLLPDNRCYVDGMNAHHPFVDYGVQVDAAAVTACRDCSWTQTVDDDLHTGQEELLLAWHTANPEQAIDHLHGWRPDMRLRIPEYIRWSGNGSGGLALVDGRTGGECHRYNHASLAIFGSVASHGDLSEAHEIEARRLGISVNMARRDILSVAASLYRAGLLQPEPAHLEGK